jgi:hypothetical protein
MLIQTKSVKSQWMGLTFGFMNQCHLTGSGILIKSMDWLSGMKWAIVWINGPFPAGRWPDVNIAHLGLIHFLDAGEYYAADGGYADGHRFASTPNGLNDYEQRTKALAHAHHETVNRCFKVFGCLSQRYRHSLAFHGTIFRAVAGIVQLTIQFGHPLFDIEYNEADFMPNVE